MKFQNTNFFKSLVTSITILFLLSLSINLFPSYSMAKSPKPKWKNQLSSLEVGKTYRYSIKHCPKKASIQFSSNHPSLASINRKSGLIRAKKPGKVVITAKIKQTKKRTKKLKTRIRIIREKLDSSNRKNTSDLSGHAQKNTSEMSQLTNQSSILEHVKFSVANSINPWNHSILLYSSRILLQSEVENTDLLLSPSTMKTTSENNAPLTAHFSSLSEDGKTVTYQLNDDSRKKLCPGNGTLDGDYKITSNFFPDSLETQYCERIHENSLCGFVLNQKQTSLAKVSIKLFRGAGDTPIASTTSNANGYYEFQNITDTNITLKAELENYDPYTISSLNPSKQNLCQNIIMHPVSTENLSVSCQILNEQNQVIKNTAVILTKKDSEFTLNSAPSPNDIFAKDESDRLFLQAYVDSNGLVSFANQKQIKANEYSKITYQSNQSLAEYFHTNMPVADSVTYDPVHTLSCNQDYVLYVFPNTNDGSIPKDYQIESFSFSFDSLLSDSLFLKIYLKELPLLSADKVSIYSDTLSNSVSFYRYSLYDKKGNELFQTKLSPLWKEDPNDYSKQLTSTLQYQQTRLADGDYYAAVTAFSASTPTEFISPNEDESVISTTTIQAVQIQNNIISSSNFTLSPCQSFHVLTYIENFHNPLENLSFTLYQKKDTSWFSIGTYLSDSFQPIHSGQKAYLTLPSSPDTSYCLIPSSAEYQITSDHCFIASNKQKDLSSAQTTDYQILLRYDPEHDTSKNNTPDLSSLLDYINLCVNYSIYSKEFFFNASTYPNTVYAHYQTDGSFVSLFLSTPSLASSENISSAFIFDRLQNGKAIHTSQTSYSTTPFFVT